jgi:hypothetical protein
MTTEERLIERCIALERVIQEIKPFNTHEETTDNQKAFLETIIGAGLWYFPHGKTYWNNKISRSAVEQLRQNPQSSLTRDHVYPRKGSAKKLLTADLGLTGEGFTLFSLYINELAVYVVVTSEENRRLINIQRDFEHGNWQEAYNAAGIELLDFNDLSLIETPEFIRLLKSKL